MVHIDKTIESLRTFGSNYPERFGTILLDLMMPKVDGYEVLRELRKGNYKRPDRVIVMSAHAQPAELEGLIALGADAFMPKPFTLTDLEEVLA